MLELELQKSFAMFSEGCFLKQITLFKDYLTLLYIGKSYHSGLKFNSTAANLILTKRSRWITHLHDVILATHIDTESYKINTPDGCNIAYFDSSVRPDDTLMCSTYFSFFFCTLIDFLLQVSIFVGMYKFNGQTFRPYNK